MGNNSSITIPISYTWFDRFPFEIILEIFDYLSLNDIIYTFFYLNQRLNNLLLQHEYYLGYLEFPILNITYLENIFKIIGKKIQYLKLTRNNFNISLKYFSNLKSIIIYSPYNLAEEQIELIIQNNQFNNLHSLKIKSNNLFFTPSLYDYSIKQEYLLQKIFNNNNSLHTFEYSSYIQSFYLKPINNLQINSNLHSLILNLQEFHDLFSIIPYTPNLIYLNIKSNPPYGINHIQTQQLNINKIKLKKFYITFNDILYETNRFKARRIDFQQLINSIQQFSLTLICLSLNLIGCYITSSNDLPFNGNRLVDEFLILMIELKQFYLYAVLTQELININKILLTFKKNFWFDHNWIIGMHDKYLYTLPFQFDKIYNFNFFHINNSESFINNTRIWYNVKFIKFRKFNLDFLKMIKIYMPKLLVLSIDYFNYSENTDDHYIIQNQENNIDIRLESITTLDLTCGSLEDEKFWLINTLPNLKYLILTQTKLPLVNSDLSLKLNENIQRLVIDGDLTIEQFANENYIYFSSLEDLQLKFDWRFSTDIYQWYADIIIKFLIYFKKLKTLSISFNPFNSELTRSTPEMELKKILPKLNKIEIEKNYEIKYLRIYVVFSKK